MIKKAAEREDWCYASAAVSLNGRLAAGLRPFGGEADQERYRALLAAAGTIVIGAETLRVASEWYRPEMGRFAVISRSGKLPKESPLLRSDCPLVVYSEADQGEYDNQLVDWRQKESWTAEEILEDISPGPVLIDGGGQIYALFAPLIDDWFITTVPTLAEQSRPEFWPSESELGLSLVNYFTADSRLLCHWRRRQS